MEEYLSLAFLLQVLQIIAIDILLGGDNAVVIALACRKLPEAQRNKGIAYGVVGAIGLRIVMIFFALQLLALPFLKIVGALLLLWIGVKLLQSEDDDHDNVEGATTLRPGIIMHQFSTLWECCAPNREPAPLPVRTTSGHLVCPLVM